MMTRSNRVVPSVESRRWRALTTWPTAGIVATALVAAACATNPVSGERELALMSESQEIATGREMDPQVRQQMGVYEDRALQEYVSGIGMRLARSSQRSELPWSFAVVDSPAVNAFALPGGFIYVTRGLLAHLDDEAELAGVVGHEIGHVTARHAVQAYSRSASANLGLGLLSIFVPDARPYTNLASAGLGALFLKHGRDDELQADRLGAEYAAQAGWDPGGIRDMLETLGRLDSTEVDRRGIPNWLATHPDPASRVERIGPVLANLRGRGTGESQVVARDAYLRHIDGLMFGENPREGVVRGNTFLHPELRIALSFPPGWRIANGKTQVVAQPEGQQALMLLDIIGQPAGRSLAEVAEGAMSGNGFRMLDGRNVDGTDLDAFVGTFEGNSPQAGRLLVRAAFFSSGRTVYRVAGLAQASQFDRIVRDVTQSISTFRTLSAAEAERIQPARIDLRTARAGDTWARLAETSDSGLSPARLAILNGYTPTQQPEAGARVKVIRTQ